MDTHRRILLGSLVAAGLALTLGCSRKASEQPVAQSQAAASANSDSASPWRMELKISPDHPSMTKPITFTIHLADERGQPVNDAQVSGALTMKVMDMGTTALKFSPKGQWGLRGFDKKHGHVRPVEPGGGRDAK